MSEVLEIIILSILILMVAMMIVGFLAAKPKVEQVTTKVDAALKTVNEDIVPKVHAMYDKVNQLNGALCGREIPLLGKLC